MCLVERGSFIIGFYVQAAMYATMAVAVSFTPGTFARSVVFICGTLAYSCRCFGWEAA